MKKLLLLIIVIFTFQTLFAQKKYVNRKVAQKNYDGYILMQEGKYDDALKLLNEAINDDPEAYFIYQNRAHCKLILKDTIGAIRDFEINIKLDSNNAESMYSLGNIYKYQKDSINAIKFFIPSIEKADSSFSQKKLLYMNNFVGNFYRLTERYDSALIYYNQVKKYTPQKSSVYINGAVCYFQLDSINKFCEDLGRAFVLGGAVNCFVLKSYCKGCNHLLEERGKTDTLSPILDLRLRGIIPDTIYNPNVLRYSSGSFSFDPVEKTRIYFNKYWQICLPQNAKYFREGNWNKYINAFTGDYTDFYIGEEIFASGRILRTKYEGGYKCYYKNGNVKIQGQFIEGIPSGKWTYFLENGDTDYNIKFSFDAFEFEFINNSNPNFHINSGTGKFRILLDQWDDIKIEISGEYLNNERIGEWAYYQDGKKLISEVYKKGKLKRGYMISDIGRIKIVSSKIDASILIPPQIKQAQNLYFESVEASKFYPFIQLRGY